MKDRVHIDRKHSRAITQKIGERLREYLKENPEPPASLRRQIDRLHNLDCQSSSTEKRPFGTRPTGTRPDED